ncbi:MAG TPA: DUF6328 family protein [Actinomycetota bacterium]|nr:DUF6328 family protein [Actinomycetota bacterium]
MSDESSRLDRELIELLNELRVMLPGVEVLFAFLLTLPFTSQFPEATAIQRGLYFTAFMSAAIAVVLLIGPTAYHRLRFREADKERMLQVANRLAISATVFLAVAVTSVVFMVTDVLFGSTAAAAAAGAVGGLVVWVWYGLPLVRRVQDGRKR